jgi:ribosomal protein S18 acetylase RimI-like enzyme
LPQHLIDPLVIKKVSILTITIAELQTNDLPALRELYLKVRQATFTWFDTSHYQLSNFDTDIAGEYTLVAHIENELAGFVSAYLPDNFIHHLYVDRTYQKRGVGTELLKAILEKLKLPVGLKCLENNGNAVDFYEKYGFKPIKKGVSVEGVFILYEYNTI